ncbi:MAG: tetratricopeptide repeat protein [Betaproteobacteria bacterium]|nr:MAG: tetratricopeptide repeat protein [Betaproteobacteria bacterium]
MVLASRGRIDEALEQYRKALELQPSYAEAHNNVGLLLARHGNSTRRSRIISARWRSIGSSPARGP